MCTGLSFDVAARSSCELEVEHTKHRRGAGSCGRPCQRACQCLLNHAHACKKCPALRPCRSVLYRPQGVLRSGVRLFAMESRNVKQMLGGMKLALRIRTSSVASHGGGGQYTCDTAEADRSMTPDQPHAYGRRGPVSHMRTHCQQHRAAVGVPRWNARRRESAGSKSKVCTCTETWVTRVHNA